MVLYSHLIIRAICRLACRKKCCLFVREHLVGRFLGKGEDMVREHDDTQRCAVRTRREGKWGSNATCRGEGIEPESSGKNPTMTHGHYDAPEARCHGPGD